MSSAQSLGYFRRFSPQYVCARILSSFTEVLQRARRYDDAIDLIRFLLGTVTFDPLLRQCPLSLDRPAYSRHRRGKLWTRLALIQENYVKISGHQQCLDTIHSALQDPCVKLGDRLTLCERARKLFQRPKSKGVLEAPWIVNDEQNLLWTVPWPKEVSCAGDKHGVRETAYNLDRSHRTPTGQRCSHGQSHVHDPGSCRWVHPVLQRRTISDSSLSYRSRLHSWFECFGPRTCRQVECVFQAFTRKDR